MIVKLLGYRNHETFYGSGFSITGIIPKRVVLGTAEVIFKDTRKK
jgi:hypothetical protein